jgi:hypothetical protein
MDRALAAKIADVLDGIRQRRPQLVYHHVIACH